VAEGFDDDADEDEEARYQGAERGDVEAEETQATGQRVTSSA